MPRWYVEETQTVGPPRPAIYAERPLDPLTRRARSWVPWVYGPRLLADDDHRTLDELIAARRRGEQIGTLAGKAREIG